MDSEKFILEHLDKIAEILEKRIKSSEVKGKTITVKIKFSDFTQQTRSKTVNEYIDTKVEIKPIVESLIRQSPLDKPVRLLGISLTKLNINDEVKSISVQLGIEF